jgi:hypothetical protein
MSPYHSKTTLLTKNVKSTAKSPRNIRHGSDETEVFKNDTPVENMLRYILEESYKISTTLLVLSYTTMHYFPALKTVTEPNEWFFCFFEVTKIRL